MLIIIAVTDTSKNRISSILIIAFSNLEICLEQMGLLFNLKLFSNLNNCFSFSFFRRGPSKNAGRNNRRGNDTVSRINFKIWHFACSLKLLTK